MFEKNCMGRKRFVSDIREILKRWSFMKTLCILGICCGVLFSAKVSFSNNLTINNFRMSTIKKVENTITYSCDVKWDNSWRTVDNYDAVWVFLKYSTDGGLVWRHASMSKRGVLPSGFKVSPGFEIIVPSDEKGFFLQRTDLSLGNISVDGVEFVWDYGQDGLTDNEAMAANTINKIFGIEMVYIPEGSFHLGDGSGALDYHFKQGSSDQDPWYIENEEAITTTLGASNGYYYQSSEVSEESMTGDVFIIPTSFPKGYAGFYQMKYELTEGQWVSFFNTLTIEQKVNRDITSSVEGGKGSDDVITRNTVQWDSTKPQFDAFTRRSSRPVSYVSWPDVLAYADWSGLRPLTEFEYEKSARGVDIVAIANEYAWGKTIYNQAGVSEIFPNGDEDGEKQIFDGAANINANRLSWSSGDGRTGGIAEGQVGPLRVGIFAENSTSRTTSGAGYYGVMEMSGNLSEMLVSVGNVSGRSFLGTHGDGILSNVSGYEGNATNLDWPGMNTIDSVRGVTGTVGSGYRGGSFNSSDVRHFSISNRMYASSDPDSLGYAQRYDTSFDIFGGGRLGRSRP